jgi:hypothetical protein
MAINAAKRRDFQNRFWQDKPIGNNHKYIGIKAGEAIFFFGIAAQSQWQETGQTQALGTAGYRCLLQFHTPSSFTGRLCIDCANVKIFM